MAALPPSVAREAVTLATPPRSAAEREWVTLLRRLVRRRTALFGMLVVLGVLLAAAFAPLSRSGCSSCDGWGDGAQRSSAPWWWRW